jgi:hypothetical protein
MVIPGRSGDSGGVSRNPASQKIPIVSLGLQSGGRHSGRCQSERVPRKLRKLLGSESCCGGKVIDENKRKAQAEKVSQMAPF